MSNMDTLVINIFKQSQMTCSYCLSVHLSVCLSVFNSVHTFPARPNNQLGVMDFARPVQWPVINDLVVTVVWHQKVTINVQSHLLWKETLILMRFTCISFSQIQWFQTINLIERFPQLSAP